MGGGGDGVSDLFYTMHPIISFFFFFSRGGGGGGGRVRLQI